MTEEKNRKRRAGKPESAASIIGGITAAAMAMAVVSGDRHFDEVGPWIWMVIMPVLVIIVTVVLRFIQSEKGAHSDEAGEIKGIADLEQRIAAWNKGLWCRTARMVLPLMVLVAAVTGLTITTITGYTPNELPHSTWLIILTIFAAAGGTTFIIAVRDPEE